MDLFSFVQVYHGSLGIISLILCSYVFTVEYRLWYHCLTIAYFEFNHTFTHFSLLNVDCCQGWGMYSTLLIDLFKFLDPFLRNTELATPVMMLYKGTLKVLLVLLHDFPEFLCDYHYGFCDEIPPNCIQMRNLILSAFPRNMRLPDPFTPNLKVDLLAEITLPPRAVINYATIIPATQFKKDLDAYIKARAPVTFLSELRSNMQVMGMGYYT